MKSTVYQKPPALRAGDTIGVVAPGSAVPREAFEIGVARLTSRGYRVYYRPDIFDADGSFAGSHQRRADEFIEMLDDPNVRAIFCARGGYGCNYLLRFLEQHTLHAPKIILGYSDVTTLHSFFGKTAGWVTFHGPMVSTDFSRDAGLAQDVLGQALSTGESWEAGRGTQVLSAGTVEGTLLGGCLSIAMTTLGTPREVDWRDAIVFLEDVGEAPYRIDRMLFQLREAGKFDGVKGIVFGEMKDCGQPDLMRHFAGAGIPVCAGFPSGHTSGPNVCLPLGVRAQLSGDRLTILEGAVS
jgi:muramoyltetrapeptide carboxypeptidase